MNEREAAFQSFNHENFEYMAFEFFDEASLTKTKQVDIWSFGCIAHELLFGYQPFKCDNNGETQKRITSEKNYKCSEKLPNISDKVKKKYDLVEK